MNFMALTRISLISYADEVNASTYWPSSFNNKASHSMLAIRSSLWDAITRDGLVYTALNFWKFSHVAGRCVFASPKQMIQQISKSVVGLHFRYRRSIRPTPFEGKAGAQFLMLFLSHETNLPEQVDKWPLASYNFQFPVTGFRKNRNFDSQWPSQHVRETASAVWLTLTSLCISRKAVYAQQYHSHFRLLSISSLISGGSSIARFECHLLDALFAAGRNFLVSSLILSL